MVVSIKNSGLGQQSPPCTLDAIQIESPSYEGLVYYVSDHPPGMDLRSIPSEYCYYTEISVTTYWVPVLLAGVFIGIELSPRFLLYRDSRSQLYYLTGRMLPRTYSKHITQDNLFEEGLSSDVRLWKLESRTTYKEKNEHFTSG